MSRPLQPPARPDAVPMPEGDSRDWLRHPGPPRATRFDALACGVVPDRLHLRAGETLLAGIAREMDRLGACGGVAILDGLAVAAMAYVQPDGPDDALHAAWYSDTRHAAGVRLGAATASVGFRDGAWFLHCHARWDDRGNDRGGHLLCDQVVLGGDAQLPVWLTRGARLEVVADAETGFSLFRPHPTGAEVAGRRGVMLTLQPHTDIRATVEDVARAHGIDRGAVIGIGSLIGAGFHDAPPMRAPISEVVVLPGARLAGGRLDRLPLAAVDHLGAVHAGDLRAGQGPVCVTCELLILAD